MPEGNPNKKVATATVATVAIATIIAAALFKK